VQVVQKEVTAFSDTTQRTTQTKRKGRALSSAPTPIPPLLKYEWLPN
jgi:hypothetical protein